ncbi:MAG: S41 family peptidase [Flavobacteriales bacterium]|nr:S41 family peptidase [Flavobacteriales bacterium]
MSDTRTEKTANVRNWAPLALACLFAAGIAIGRYWDEIRLKRPYGDRTKLEQVIQLVQDQYVDTVSSNDLEQKSINYFLHALDPHSVYIPASDVGAANQDLKGSFDGIGVEFFLLNDTPCVSRVIPDGPAFKAGMLPADRILAADSASLIGMSNEDIINRIKGKRKSIVHLDVYRPHRAERLDIPIERGQIRLETVSSALLNDSTAYIRISHFAEPTHDEFASHWKELNTNSTIRQVVFDLRDNPGGYLQVAMDLLDEFVGGEQLLAYTVGKGKYRKSYYSTKGGLCTGVALICLVNERSASASEIFSGTIQDLDRGLVIGTTTFGKGLVQETFQLRDASQIRLTVSRYYIPSGRSIQKPYTEMGYVPNPTEQSDTFFTKNKRKVYARGGIQPDIPMPAPISGNWNAVTVERIRFIDENYELINSIASPKAYWESSDIDQAIKRISRDLPVDSETFKAAIAYQFYGDDAALQEPAFRKYLEKVNSYFRRMERLLNP